MIKFIFKWIYIQIKLNLRSLSFYLLTLLISLSFFLTRQIVHEYNEDVNIQIYLGEDEKGRDISEYLNSADISGFSFESAKSYDDMILSVKKGDISCGVSFEDEKIVIYQAPGVSDGYVLGEILFPAVLRVESSETLRAYLENMQYIDLESGQIIPSKEAIEYVENRFDEYVNNMNVDIYDISTQSTNQKVAENNNEKRLVIIIRIVTILFVLLFSVYDNYGVDKGFYSSHYKSRRILLKLCTILVTVLMSIGIAGVINCFVFRF